MIRRSVVLVFTLAFMPGILFSSCSSKKPKPATAESKATFSSMRLGLPGTVSGVLTPTNVYLTSDPSIVALAEFSDLKEEIMVRWDWLSPDDRVYISASTRRGPSEVGMYYPNAAFSHALLVDGEKASQMPGLWKVELYVDGNLKETQRFNLEPGLVTLKNPRIPPDPLKWALVIGIERYSHLPPVVYAASDARKVTNYFVNLLGVPEANVVILENERATRASLSGRLKDYLPKNMGPGSTLYVYFAGHGMPDVGSGEPFLMLFDSEATNVARTGYRLKEYLGDIGSLPVRQAFVFTDACFSGMASRGNEMLVPGARPAVLQVEDVSLATGKVVAMGASTGAQLSHAYADKRQGLFTYYLLSGILGEADNDGDGSVVLGELYGYVKDNVERVSRRTTTEQVPSVTPRIEEIADARLVEAGGGSKGGRGR